MRVFAVDLDGTLLTDRGTVSDRTRAAVMKAIEQQVRVVVATGRILPTALAAVQSIPAPLPVVCLNGALVYDRETDTLLVSKTIEPQLAHEVIQMVQQCPVHWQAFGKQTLYSTSWTPLLTFLRKKYAEDLISIQIGEIPKHEPLYKISLDGAQDEIAEVKKRLRHLPLAVFSSESGNIEITHLEATKGKALETLLVHYGAAREDLVAFGNQSNDLPMFDVAAVSVAVSNANEEVKQRASIITKSNNENGVALAIEQLLSKP